METTGLEISIVGFEKLTGSDFTYFVTHILSGDAWGSFLKMASLLEASSKRAVGMRLGLDPSSESVGRIEFSSALLLCKETGLTSAEAFEFANYIRQVRNDLVHKAGFSTWTSSGSAARPSSRNTALGSRLLFRFKERR